MDNNRFDRLTKQFATHFTRRSIIGGASAFGAVSLVTVGASAAQVATPAATPTASEDNWLLVMNFEGAALSLSEDGASLTISLERVDNHVMAFTDRPAREYHLTPVEIAVESINSAALTDPLNAALVARPSLSQGSLDLAVTLRSADLDRDTGILALEATVLGGQMLTTSRVVAPGETSTLKGGNLFIDDASLGGDDSCAGNNDTCGYDEDTGQTIQCCPNQDLTCKVYSRSCDQSIPENCFYDYTCQPPPPPGCAKPFTDCGTQKCCAGLTCLAVGSGFEVYECIP